MWMYWMANRGVETAVLSDDTRTRIVADCCIPGRGLEMKKTSPRRKALISHANVEEYNELRCMPENTQGEKKEKD